MRASLAIVASFLAFLSGSLVAQSEADFSLLRKQMVERHLADRDIRDRRVLEVMEVVPRHLFVPLQFQAYSYADHPLPIGYEQTISQPYIVALMTQLSAPQETDRALEVGTGSGYQAAVLAQLVREVFSIEIVPELADRAGKTLQELGYRNVSVKAGDGYAGWEAHAPFNIILITAAAPEIPPPLLRQLAEGGRIVVPVGKPAEIQRLMVYTKKGGRIAEQEIIPVRFVPLTGTGAAKP